MLGDKIHIETSAGPTPPPATDADSDTLSLAEFRKALALGQIQIADAANPLRIRTTAGTSQAVIVGTRKVVTNLVAKKNPKDGKALAPEPFSVSVS